MAKYTAADVGFFLISGYDMLGYTTKFEMNNDAKMEDTTVFGNTWAQQAPVNLREFSASHEAFYDDAALASDVALRTQVGTNRIISIGLETNTQGKRFIGFEGPFESNYERKVSRGSLHKIAVTWGGSGVTDDGIISYPQGVISGASSNGTGTDNGALTSTGLSCYFQLTSLTATNITMKIQHSTTDSAYVDLVTFAVLSAAPGVSRVTVATGTTINRWTRVLWTMTGGSAAAGMVGIARK